MKTRFLLLMTIATLLFTQCKKKEEISVSDESSDLVKVSFELPVEQDKSDFTSVLPDGNINWGNSNNIEYMYLAVGDRYLYYNHDLQCTVRVGELFEMQAEVNGPTDKLMFTGMIPQNLLYASKRCTLYYFGNNGRGGDGSNVTNIYDEKYQDCVIGKTISFSEQNGRIEDFRIAAQILKDKKINPDVRLLITPSSRAVMLKIVEEGLAEIFIKAGAAMVTAGCGACVGVHAGILGDDEVCLSTQNRNFQGRMGNTLGNIYLCSPAVAAYSAIKGHIADPREIL